MPGMLSPSSLLLLQTGSRNFHFLLNFFQMEETTVRYGVTWRTRAPVGCTNA